MNLLGFWLFVFRQNLFFKHVHKKTNTVKRNGWFLPGF